MIRMFTYIFLMTLVFQGAMAMPHAVVEKLRGNVIFNDTQLKKGDSIKVNGLITTAGRSFVKLSIKEWGATLVIGPRSEMMIRFDNEKMYWMEAGSVRWVTKLKTKVRGNPPIIFTPSASMGVRGTEYFVKVNRFFQGTEIVVLDGEVKFTNSKRTSDSTVIKKNQWGGVGGRFGENIGEIVNLKEPAVKHFNSLLNL